MRRWTSLVLAGALGWPASSFAQETLPAASQPDTNHPGVANVQRNPLERPEPDGLLPVVPPLPPAPRSAPVAEADSGAGIVQTQANGEMKRPSPAGPVAARPAPYAAMPRSTGEEKAYSVVQPGPHGHPMPFVPGHMPPGAAVPLVPTPCPPPPPQPDCGPCNECGPLWIGEFLFLRASRRDPVIQAQLVEDITSFNSLIAYDADHEYAYRVGGGWLTEGGWLFLATYMQFTDNLSDQIYFNPDPTGSFSLTYVGPGQLLNSTLAQPGFIISSWNLQFRSVDIFFGGVFSPTNYLDIVAGGGLKLLWMDQDYRTTVDASASDGVIQGENLTINTRGMGPRMGGEARAYIFPWLNLYGRGFGSLLLTHRNDDSLLVETGLGGINNVSFVTYSREEIVPVLELAAGAEVTVWNGRLQFGGGYEFTYVWQGATSTVDALSTPRVVTHNDLSLDGFYARIVWLW
jgi:hypothetical protein